MSLAPLAITAGEPAGIGFDIILQSISELRDCIVIADQDELQARAEMDWRMISMLSLVIISLKNQHSFM